MVYYGLIMYHMILYDITRYSLLRYVIIRYIIATSDQAYGRAHRSPYGRVAGWPGNPHRIEIRYGVELFSIYGYDVGYVFEGPILGHTLEAPGVVILDPWGMPWQLWGAQFCDPGGSCGILRRSFLKSWGSLWPVGPVGRVGRVGPVGLVGPWA